MMKFCASFSIMRDGDFDLFVDLSLGSLIVCHDSGMQQNAKLSNLKSVKKRFCLSTIIIKIDLVVEKVSL